MGFIWLEQFGMLENGYNAKELLIEFAEPAPPLCTHPHSFLAADLEADITNSIAQSENHSPSLTDELDRAWQSLQDSLPLPDPLQLVRVRVHQLAISKILVFAHGRSDFRLVAAHFAVGRAYLEAGGVAQATAHLTVASTKVGKMGEVRGSKVYNSYILTALGQCYFEAGSPDYSLEVLTRAYDIQCSSQSQKQTCLAAETLLALARAHLRLGSHREAARVADKLIDLLAQQTAELQSLHRKLVQLCGPDDGSRPKRRQDELAKLQEAVGERVESLVVDCDRGPIREALRRGGAGEAAERVREILGVLVGESKRTRIFKFRIFAEEEGGINNAVEQELRGFLQEFDEEQEGSLRKLTRPQAIEVYKLLVHYSARFFDQEGQLNYLHRLETAYAQQSTPEAQLGLLRVKRNLALLAAQRHMKPQTEHLLVEIKQLEAQLFGSSSQAVQKTSKMLRILRLAESQGEERPFEGMERKEVEGEGVQRKQGIEVVERRQPRSRLRKTVALSNPVAIVGRHGSNRLIL